MCNKRGIKHSLYIYKKCYDGIDQKYHGGDEHQQ